METTTAAQVIFGVGVVLLVRDIALWVARNDAPNGVNVLLGVASIWVAVKLMG